MHRFLLLSLGVLLAGSLSLRCEEPKRMEEAKAREIFADYLKKRGMQDYLVAMRPFGASTWCIDAFSGEKPPRSRHRCVMSAPGEVREVTAESLSAVFRNEYPSALREEDRKKLMQEFANILAGEKNPIVKTAADIPGYDKRPLDSDLAGVIREPFSFGNLVTVAYTYQRVEGVVRRYRFEFTGSGLFQRADCAVLGRGVGSAIYYQ